jgi:hypothetical protein
MYLHRDGSSNDFVTSRRLGKRKVNIGSDGKRPVKTVKIFAVSVTTPKGAKETAILKDTTGLARLRGSAR